MSQADPRDCPHAGFTLFEILVVMVVSMILLVQGLPALQSVMASLQLQARSQLLHASLMLARSEAIRGNRPVWVCALNSKVNLEIQGCQPAGKDSVPDWGEGVLVFADDAQQANGRYDSGERLHHALFSASTIRVSASQHAFAFSASGRLEAGPLPRFELRSSQGQCHRLQLQPGGRVQWCRQEGCCA
jgi:type IV fimbrial biogenesis protein FimT